MKNETGNKLSYGSFTTVPLNWPQFKRAEGTLCADMSKAAPSQGTLGFDWSKAKPAQGTLCANW